MLVPRSIVAVHGLASDPLTTWRAYPETKGHDDGSNNAPMWLKDFLPHEDGIKIRVFAFNHNTAWKYDALTKSLRDHGEDLLSALRLIRQGEEVSYQLASVLGVSS